MKVTTTSVGLTMQYLVHMLQSDCGATGCVAIVCCAVTEVVDFMKFETFFL